MCTSVLYNNNGIAYFGRNLDLQYAMGNSVAVVPRNFKLNFNEIDAIDTHAAMVGMCLVEEGYPLFFEAVNEFGVGIAGLNFSGFCKYSSEKMEGKANITSYELIPYLLATSKSVEDVRKLAENMNILDTSINAKYPASPLHWMASDKNGSIVIEQTETGLHIYDNPINVLTNQPDYPFHYYNFCNYINVTAKYPNNRIAPKENLPIFGTAMGSNGLPGGLSSVERFVRVGFTLANSLAADTDDATLSQYFHIMQSVGQADGCDQVEDGLYEITQYTCGANLETMDFYWSTYNNQRINGLHTKSLNLDSDSIMDFPVSEKQDVNFIN